MQSEWKIFQLQSTSNVKRYIDQRFEFRNSRLGLALIFSLSNPRKTVLYAKKIGCRWQNSTSYIPFFGQACTRPHVLAWHKGRDYRYCWHRLSLGADRPPGLWLRLFLISRKYREKKGLVRDFFKAHAPGAFQLSLSFHGLHALTQLLKFGCSSSAQQYEGIVHNGSSNQSRKL